MTHAAATESGAVPVDAARSDALSDPDLRRVVAVLSLSQVVSWGCLYYGFAALHSSITADTGWSASSVTGAFSTALAVSAGVGLWVGRRLDSHGPRAVMTAASLLAVPGMALVATSPTLVWFYAGWLIVGAAMGGTLYPPAFAALTRWGGQRRVRALTAVTLAGGLASTVFAPVAVAVDAAAGWRTAYLVLMSVAVGVTLPLHWWGLRHRWTRPAVSTAAASGPPATTANRVRVATSRHFVALALANALVALAAFAVIVNLVPMLREQGMSTQTAALVLGLGGVGQVIGRIGYGRLAASVGVTTCGVVVAGAVAMFTAALAVAPPVAWLVVTLGMMLGLARGLHTLVHATAVTDRWGPASYGRLNGILTAPALAASAAAPFTGALLAGATGSYGAAFLILAAVAAAGAALMVAATPSSEGPGRGLATRSAPAGL